MQRKSWLPSLVLLAAAAVAVPAFAKPLSKSLPLNHAVHVGKYDVSAGDYNVLIDGNHMTLKKNSKVVAEADGRWEDRNAKSEYTEILSDSDGKVLELRFAGNKSAFVLSN
jgi:hypothetical protein